MTDLMKWFDTRRSPVDLIERLFEGETGTSAIRVEELVDGNTLVVRAELPGIDPEKDVDVTVSDGVLAIKAQRQEKKEHKEKDSYRSEFRYGSFVRRLPLPNGVQQSDVTASYKDGVLEVRAPLPDQGQEAAASKIPITRG
ncbi:Hsp20/alpha crystallin family protein [Pseudarthrobacter phenanthrenivorans]|uniref:Hsp20/alpha crystallin family protein n=1 Tax=Pseudarthrobacter phenanthrenivorans TaxID=361575 RepID=A0A3B0FBY6_PSEPS|nr:Hsp20/alpha crystallin family protein [Pseudarthrobacter phenanthrenivorans]RKO24176.1 Hsp20/alpha crystallin family protein [Pseudarthrobacter phenanthrenivorans]TPV53158.1 Hsp20/alpha crystallin family protein [Pseudarthrobacter phenanthrenivorans]